MAERITTINSFACSQPKANQPPETASPIPKAHTPSIAGTVTARSHRLRTIGDGVIRSGSVAVCPAARSKPLATTPPTNSSAHATCNALSHR